jgi:hypothetical protein
MNDDVIAETLLEWQKRPELFAEAALGFEPDDWQKETLAAIRDHSQIAVASGQGVGKTSIEAVVVLWFLTCFENAKVVCTAPTMQQLNDVLWAEVAKWLNGSEVDDILKWTKTKVYMIGNEERWFATARTATKPENMQGFHEENLLFIVDEASGIDEQIMEAILGTLTGANNKIVMMSNPTKTSGTLFDAFHKDKQDWITRKVSSADSTRTNKKNIARLIRRYGEDSDVVRVRVLGEFPKGEPNAFLKLEDVEAAMNRELPAGYTRQENGAIELPSFAPVDLGVDVARFGTDETVMATRLGAYLMPLKSWQGQDTMKTVGQIVKQAKALHDVYQRTVRVKLDDTGVGGGVTDRLREVVDEDRLDWLKIYPVNFASKGNRDYEGIISVMYGQFKDEHLDDCVLPNDDDLAGQLSIRRYSITSKGKIQIERKQAMKDRGLQSPDRAEATIMAFYEPAELQAQFFKEGI